jgi:hypothetical protein
MESMIEKNMMFIESFLSIAKKAKFFAFLVPILEKS